jgi:ComF family protein
MAGFDWRGVWDKTLAACLAGPGFKTRRCAVCGRGAEAALGHVRLCVDCAAGLSLRAGGYCPLCGATFGDGDEQPMPCVSCRRKPPPWTGFSFYAAYEVLLRECVLAYKFGGGPRHTEVLRTLVLAAYERGRAFDGPGTLDPDGPEVIAPVPLHPRRLRWRGFNQSLELACALAGTGRGVVSPKALARTRNTMPQSTLSGAERRENIKGAFAADGRVVGGRSVLLVDDVMTTGATVEQAVQALREAGAARVDVLVLAR